MNSTCGEQSRTTCGEQSRTTCGEQSRTTCGERSRTIYGERIVLSEVEGLVLKARPKGSRTMVMRIGRMLVKTRGSSYCMVNYNSIFLKGKHSKFPLF